MKKRATIPLARASVASYAAGRPAKPINGSASAVIRGTPSTRAACARPACISGLKPSASHAADGRRTRSGMQNYRMSAYAIRTFESRGRAIRPHEPIRHDDVHGCYFRLFCV